ncbi:TrmB family transcriptional regulator [Thermococcus sp.]
MDEKEIQMTLKEFGLNEYEVRVYLTLLRNGPLTAGELAVLSKVPQPRIYDVTRTLMAKGFVTTSQDRPKHIIPVNPDTVMTALKRKYEEKITALQRALEKIYTPKEEIGSVTVIKNKLTLESYIKKTIEEAKFHISMAIPTELLKKLEETLIAKKNSNVRIHLFVYGSENVPPIANEIRVRDVPDPIIIIGDRKMGIYLPYEALTTGSSLHGYALIIRDNNLLFILNRYFYHALWPTGKTIYKEKRTLQLPREYIHIRELIEDIRNSDVKDLKVKVIGHFIRSGKPVQLTGRLVSYFEDKNKVISNITIETDDGKRYVIGGWNSSLEDIEAERILVFKEECAI